MSKTNILLLLLLLATLASGSRQSTFKKVSPALLKLDLSLSQFILRSNAALQENPDRGMECFDIYIPELNNIAEQYEIDYGQCMDQASKAKAGIECRAHDDRNQLTEAVRAVCELYSICNEKKGLIEFFTCHQTMVSLPIICCYMSLIFPFYRAMMSRVVSIMSAQRPKTSCMTSCSNANKSIMN